MILTTDITVCYSPDNNNNNNNGGGGNNNNNNNNGRKLLEDISNTKGKPGPCLMTTMSLCSL